MSLQTVVDHVQYWTAWDQGKIAFTFYRPDETNMTLTRQQVSDYAAQCGIWLQKQGLKASDVLCTLLSNSPERLVVELGALYLGVVVFNAQQFRTNEEALTEYLRLCQARCLLLDPGESGGGYTLLKQLCSSINMKDKSVMSQVVPSLRKLIFVTRDENNLPCLWDEIKKEKTAAYSLHRVDLSDPAILVPSSPEVGGHRRLVLHNHDTILQVGRFVAKQYRVPDHTSVFIQSNFRMNPMFWHHYVIFGIHTVMADLRAGEPRDEAAFTFRVIQSQQCGAAILFPELLDAISSGAPFKRQVTDQAVKPIIHTCGEPLTPSCLNAVGRVATEVTASLHLAETGPIAVQGFPNEDVADTCCVGKYYVRARVRILDDRLVEVEHGETGHIVMKGPSLFQGYYRDADATKSSIVQDCQMFMTGCKGFLDEQERLYVTARGVPCPRSNDVRGADT